ncbi:glycosyltransferase family 2 protein [Acidiferrimicrobium sp. IK]|uniref:glycosyltransferase family 2 protein n=1 Tax=Acidiferrimicrobium sp. IK TaxID=2871700 RepID=UPI0021CB6C37|nr:glycosyltransferase family 2 protein [Acidiferrimicrobium sp. IK]MCU4185705.1 glycosyltransferase family 2 protein [Acidiferrimicrobium sp. IK]
MSGTGPEAGFDAVVVNYNAAGHLGPCLASLRAAGATRVVVVDNGSTDDSAAVVAGADPDATWMETGANLGYGKAANLAAAALDADHLVIANPDLVVGGHALRALRARLDAEPDLGIVGPRILNPDGSLYPSARTFPDMVDAIGHGLLGGVAPRNPFTRRYRLLDWDHSQPARVDWVSGACFLIRRTVWDRLGGFDPAYFMYLEDVDLCWRASKAGWAVGYEPAAEVVHVQGVSANQHPYRMLAAHHQSMWRFAWRSTEGPKRLALPVVAVGLAARLALSCAQHKIGAARSVPPVQAQ